MTPMFRKHFEFCSFPFSSTSSSPSSFSLRSFVFVAVSALLLMVGLTPAPSHAQPIEMTNGYLMGRHLVSLQHLRQMANAQRRFWATDGATSGENRQQMQRALRAAPLKAEAEAAALISDGTYAKKSSLLKKFGGSGARNCYFTPVSCMIQHDMSKYKKLVETSRLEGFNS